MKKQIKKIMLFTMSIVTSFTVSSCLGDGNKGYEEQIAFLQKALTNSLGAWSGTLNFTNMLKQKEDLGTTSWNIAQDEKSYNITISDFPISKIANSINIPTTTTPESKELQDSLTFIKEGIAKLANINYKSDINVTDVGDPSLYFILTKDIDFTLTYLGKEHYYTLMLYNKKDFYSYAQNYSSMYTMTPEAMKINGLFLSLVEKNKEGNTSKVVNEYSPTQFFFSSTSHTK